MAQSKTAFSVTPQRLCYCYVRQVDLLTIPGEQEGGHDVCFHHALRPHSPFRPRVNKGCCCCCYITKGQLYNRRQLYKKPEDCTGRDTCPGEGQLSNWKQLSFSWWWMCFCIDVFRFVWFWCLLLTVKVWQLFVLVCGVFFLRAFSLSLLQWIRLLSFFFLFFFWGVGVLLFFCRMLCSVSSSAL